MEFTPDQRSETLTLAVVFGVLSVPWTYGFIATLELPLWPSFVAAATFYAAGGRLEGLRLGLGGNLLGIGYATATLALVEGVLGGGVLALSLVVGTFMLLASLHPLVDPVEFAPAGFIGYATMFGVHASGTGILLPGLAGQGLVTAVTMLIGATLGLAAEQASRRVARTRGSPIDP